MIGKVPPGKLAELVLNRAGSADARVCQGPAYGEDTAAIDLGDDCLVVNTDPISMAVDRIGTLGVNVAANDVAASGATPAWLTTAIFLPTDAEETLDRITAQIDAAARRHGIAIVGGHTEYAPTLDTPLVVLTCLGLADRYVPTGGAEPGDRILVTTGAGIEGTAILATDFTELVADEVSPTVLDRGEACYDDVCVIGEAAALTDVAHAMHDPTEGGLVNGLVELAIASGVDLDIDPDAIPVRDETARLCAAAGVDPHRIFGSGALLAAVPETSVAAATEALQALGVSHAVVGTAHESEEPAVTLGPETHATAIRDDMYPLWE